MTMQLEFTVDGDPVPQGSVRSFARNGRTVTTNDPTGKIERWRGDIRSACRQRIPGNFTKLEGPLRVTIAFRVRRPQAHYLPANSRRPSRVLRPDAPIYHAQDPDTDKLARAVLDALTNVVWLDDNQVAKLRASKVWAEYPGATIGVGEIEDDR